jgi:hypothetical protein
MYTSYVFSQVVTCVVIDVPTLAGVRYDQIGRTVKGKLVESHKCIGHLLEEVLVPEMCSIWSGQPSQGAPRNTADRQ